MHESANPYASPRTVTIAAQASVSERAEFIQRTYLHLSLAIGAFVGLEFMLLNAPGIEALIKPMMGGRFAWFVVLGAFMLVSWIADKWARSSTSPAMQYAGLGLFVLAEAVIFLPLLYIAVHYAGPSVLPTAAGLTLAVFAALTAVVFIWKADFSFLRGVIAVSGMVAMGLIGASLLFGFNLGVIFSGAMVAFASMTVLYKTSNILRVYRTDQHVAAALGLFASVALLFWYILQIVLSTSRD
jgi:FtsH-binding integral membrane protein